MADLQGAPGLSLTVRFWCVGCMRECERIFRAPYVPTHINVFGMRCVPCSERELTEARKDAASQADGTSRDVDEGGDDNGSLVSV